MQCFQKKKYVDEYVFRPDYPDELYATIMEYLGEKVQLNASRGKYPLAIDVGCGTGRSTFSLLKHFDRVVGIDPSDTMLEEATEKSWSQGVEFCKGNAEDLVVQDSSACLVTVGTALHWFKDFDKFYKEVDRVLVPGGVVAAYCYSWTNLEIINHPNSTELTNILTELVMVPFDRVRADEPMKLGLSSYGDESCQIPYVDRQRCDTITVEVKTTLGRLLGYGKSLNYFVVMEENEPEWTRNWINKLEKRFLEACNADDLTYTVTWRVHFFMIMGRKPAGCSEEDESL